MEKKLYEKIERYCREEQLLEEGDGVVLGVSGGADSVFLLRFFLWIRERWKLRLYIVHVNHGIRGEEADSDRDFVKELADGEEAEFIEYEASVPKLAKEWKMTEEEAGRTYRYQCFEEVSESCGCEKIAVAHHRDDQAETVLFQFLRGSGLKGLGGMRPKRGKIIRPLLCVSGEEILETLNEAGISYCIDSTNHENIYARNRIRNQLYPWIESELQPGAKERIAGNADYLRDIMDYIEAETEKKYNETVRREGAGLVLDEDVFSKLFPAIQRELLMKMIVSLAGKRKDILAVHIEQVRHLFLGGTGKMLYLPYGLLAKKEYSRLCIEKKEKLSQKRFAARSFSTGEIYEIPFTTGEKSFFSVKKEEIQHFEEYAVKKYCTKCFDYDKIVSVPLFRYYAQGDYLWMDLSGKKKKLSRLFIDEKISRERRSEIIVLAEGDHVIWIPELGRVSAYYYLSEQTTQIIYIEKKGD